MALLFMTLKINEQYIFRITAGVVWLIVFTIYRITLAPSVGYIDSGELAAVANTLGIAHPTGYPLYTILGRVSAMIPIAADIIIRLNLLSAVLTSSSAVLFFFIIIELLRGEKKIALVDIVISASFAALSMAFSRTFWLQGVSAEVYSLHLFLICSVILIFLKALKSDEPRWWILFAFLVGLAFTNHMTTILLAPALMFWFFQEHGLNKNALKRISILSLPFIAGLSVYLYLPVRASQHPLFNWGNPQSLETFWWHITGKQFRVWMFSSGDAAKKQLDYFFGNLTNEFHFIVLIIALIGAAAVLFTDRRKFFVLLILFITCISYSVNYDIHDIDSYFLLAYIVIGLCSAFGLRTIIRRSDQKMVKAAIAAAGVAVIVIQVNGQWHVTNQQGNFMVEDYTKNILTNLPPNSIVISTQWDYFIAASYYYQHVDKIRPDVVVLDKELFRRSWYFPQLEKMYPDVMKRSSKEAADFRKELFKFEHDLPYEYNAIEGRYTALLKSLADRSGPSVVFVSSEIETQYVAGYQRIPEGFLFRLTRDTVYQPYSFPVLNLRNYEGSDAYTKSLKTLMMNALLYRASYERFFGNDSLSAFYSKKASEITANSTTQVSIF